MDSVQEACALTRAVPSTLSAHHFEHQVAELCLKCRDARESPYA